MIIDRILAFPDLAQRWRRLRVNFRGSRTSDGGLTSSPALTIVRIIRNKERVMSVNTSPEQARLLAGVIAHLSRYLDTGCPRAAHQAGLLLRRLDADGMDQELMTSCEELDRVISHPPCPPRPGLTALSPISKRPRSRSSKACAASISTPAANACRTRETQVCLFMVASDRRRVARFNACPAGTRQRRRYPRP